MRGFVKYLMLLLAGILAASCVFDADRPVLSADEPHGIMFTVSLDNHTTRASWDEEYDKEDGLPFDIRIQPDGLSVVVLAEDGTRLGNIQDLGYWPTNEKHTEFQFIGQMPDEFVSHFNANNGEGRGWSYNTITVEVTNHYLAIGVTANNLLTGKEQFTGAWMGADDWKLVLVKKAATQSEFNPFAGIENLETVAPAQVGIYDLFGRRIETPTVSGIYIVNGKKTVIKK